MAGRDSSRTTVEAGASGRESGLAGTEPPIRAELLSLDRLAERARELAREQESTTENPPRTSPLAPQIDEARRTLEATRSLMAEAVQAGRAVSPSVEWLLDNSYLVEEQLREIREDLPRTYSLELPRLVSGPLKDMPRVYEAAVTLVAHTDARLDREYVVRFISAYQEVSPLKIGEVWAVPIMLRIALAENLRRLAVEVARTQLDERAADEWADSLLSLIFQSPGDLDEATRDLERSRARASASFYLRLLQRLQDEGEALGGVLQWVQTRIDQESGGDRDSLTRGLHQGQAADQVTIANTITSMRFITALDWKAFFEQVSLVEAELRKDPAGVYANMDFATRDRYRHAVESLARRSPISELEVVRAVVARSEASLDTNPSDLTAGHVGYYLISRGRYELERSLKYRPRRRERIYRGPLSHREAIYWGGWLVLALVFEVLLGVYLSLVGAATGTLVLLMLLAFVPLSDLSLSVVNRVTATLWPPMRLPKLDYEQPVADAHRTLVVVPSLVTSPAGVQEIVNSLEIHYLANPDPNIHYALLGDLKSAATPQLAGDTLVLDSALDSISQLNQRYASGSGQGPFHLFIRGRTWSETEGVWMGWERKRGALVELNRVLKGEGDNSFVRRIGDESFLPGVTFVLTVDQDTLLPRDAANKLICTIAHPLNRAHVDHRKRTVSRGYGLVQPRVAMSLPSAHKSAFARLFSGSAGIDPYALAASDTYQDVFGEGSFTGKGIYEVSVFNTVLENRVPNGVLLSHDLLEGSFLRTALASDVEVFDEYPSTYIAYYSRLHRWVRGDWQASRWILPLVPDATGKLVPNQLTLLSRWKLLDNLRRSLFPPTLVAAVGLGLLLDPGPWWSWPLLAAAVVFFPVYMSFADQLLNRPGDAGIRRSLRHFLAETGVDAARSALVFVTLPHQAYQMLDSVVRAEWRMWVSHKKLLEWETAAEAEQRALGQTLFAHYRRMLSGLVVAALALTPALVLVPAHRPVALALLIVWLLAPILAYQVSRAEKPRAVELDAEDLDLMRRITRKTWRFFDRFVTVEDHWLAPDNFQEDPKGEIAHRTSPTNIGLQLLACSSAHDLGYVGLLDYIERVSRTLQTMAGMERFRGHFYNWYDTLTLRPLYPGYISTVDSGNLAGNLLTLRLALLEASEGPIVRREALSGISDTLRVALEDVNLAKRVQPASDVLALKQAMEELRRRVTLDEPPRSLAGWRSLLEELARVADDIALKAATLGPPESSPDLERLRSAVAEVVASVRTHAGDVAQLAPWAALLDEAPTGARRDGVIEELRPLFDFVPSLVGLAEGLSEALGALKRLADEPPGHLTEEERLALASWAGRLREGILAGRSECLERLAIARLMADIAREMWENTDFRMLYDESRQLFSIGLNTAEGRLDNSYYDMLASECRLASYLSIAKGDVPQSHWFRLGRTITLVDGHVALLSWSASMFEYLMPLLLMATWEGTLLDQTYWSVVRRQVQYGRQRGVPWGVSESAFNAKDADLTYQYQAFGVPGLGLKRGLSDDVVVAPYATCLALQVDPKLAIANLSVLTQQGAEGRYGYYESVDYTPGRVPAGKERAIVRAYMAHHQGMSLVALANELTGNAMRRRFRNDPLVESAELLLQERVPRHVPVTTPHIEEVQYVRSVRELPPPVTRSYPLADTPVPATHFLSNGRYSVMVTNGGGGYSRWRDLAVTRYREDVTRDCWGTFFYLRDQESGEVWSAAHQPSVTQADDYHVIFSADKAEFKRRDGDIETHTEIVVSPEDDAEIRRITITNHGRADRTLEVTSYFEIALAPQEADRAHRTFSNLFVETDAETDLGALLFTRRPRSADEKRSWGVHVLACESPEACDWQLETDRARFLGRLHQTHNAQAVLEGLPLSGTTGAVLDPVCSIRKVLKVAAGETARLAFATGCAETREDAVTLAERYRDIRSAQRALDLAWTSSQIELRDLGISPEQAVVFQRLASRLLLTDPHSRLKVKTPVENGLPLSGLWGIGISGDLPILLVKLERLEETPLVRQMLLAHQYWRHKGLVADLVILNTRPTAYVHELDERLKLLVRTGHALQLMDKPGGVFLRRADQMHPDVLNLLETVARATIEADKGPLVIQLNQRADRPDAPSVLMPKSKPRQYESPAFERPVLLFDNGYGGFDPKAREYVIVLSGDQTTPAPWVNVMANPEFGSLVSEAGVGCTWSVNSHENRLTTWNNDPVSDGSGEAVYVRDEETGEFWSPTPKPVRDSEPYVVRHGHGYSVFEHSCHGIEHELTWFVPPEDPIRIARLRLRNLSADERTLMVTNFVEWVLGSSRSRAQQLVVTWFDAEAEMMTAHNHYNEDFPGRPTFLATDGELHSYTGSRTEFIGRNGAPDHPAAMRHHELGAVTGRFHDNCGAVAARVILPADGEVTISFFLGQTEQLDDARKLVRKYREPGVVDEALQRTKAWWGELLGTVEVKTPDLALDLMVNGQLMYQSLACRLWGRTGFYQSSGAFGFRDQLQDTLPYTLAKPYLMRDQVLEAARHQFARGDVMHWWMPVSNRGVRTRITDDRHWMPLVVAEYLEATGDTTLLDEHVPFVEGPELAPEAEDAYITPRVSERTASIYDHCVAALESGRGTGSHGLPLMGGGDWNDGMNHVGIGGKGESVWLAWFLGYVLMKFARVCDIAGDHSRADSYRRWSSELAATVEASAWDGAWYRRAYFDDGTPLGTKQAEECKIDSVTQSWAVINGMGDQRRAMRALDAVEEHLLRWEDELIMLLHPPFDRMPKDPGYIKGYVPGVRENGGQYTHAALWVVLAHALQGEGDEAVAMLDLINPINHTVTGDDVDLYRVEPYVVAADIYSAPPHTGRGGWTWYTGSASWFYNVAVRNVLGIHVSAEDGSRYVTIDPCIPKSWSGYEMTVRVGKTSWQVSVRNPRGVNRGVARLEVDGTPKEDLRFPLVDDGGVHKVSVTLIGG